MQKNILLFDVESTSLHGTGFAVGAIVVNRGGTGKMAFLNKRKCIMSEISLEYCEMSKQRLLSYTSNIGLFV